MAKVVTAATAAAALFASGCRLPPIAQDRDARNVVVHGRFAYAALGAVGIEVVDLDAMSPDAGELLPGVRPLHGVVVAPPGGLQRVDDLALDDDRLLLLDALGKGVRGKGELGCCSLAEPRNPQPRPITWYVPVGPFSGVSCGAGRTVVSGGTSDLTFLDRDPIDSRPDAFGSRATSIPAIELDLGRGQPDVLVTPDGRFAYVSTHFRFWADTFGLTVVDLDRLATTTEGPDAAIVARLEIPGAGYGAGALRPANFPLECALAGERLVVAHAAGLSLFDVTERAAPRLVARLDCPVGPVNVDALGDRAVVVGSSPSPRLVVVGGVQSTTPHVAHVVDLPTSARPTAVSFVDATSAVVAVGPDGVLHVEWREAPR